MKKSILALFMLSACGAPPQEFPPFIQVSVVDPVGFVAPLGETWEVTTSAIINGNPISNTNEILDPANPLPSDFTVSFSEQVRGQNVIVEVQGFSNGLSVFTARGAGTAGADSIEIVARFCGDNALDDDRSEACDNGENNSDTAPDACRSDCSLARCGDAIIDSGEACDDGDSNSDTVADACRLDCSLPSCGDNALDSGEECDDSNNIDADGCEADCTLPACQNGILDPEDFEGDLCYFENTPNNFAPDSLDIEVADMDNDGFQDVIFGQGNDVKIAFGNGQGSFSEIKSVSTDSPSILAIEIADFDNNNLLDIATSSITRTTISTIKNSGLRSFSLLTNVQISNSVIDFIVGEFTGDSRRDLVVVNIAGELLLASGRAGGFNTPVILNFTSTGTITSIETDDVDSDSKADIVFIEKLSNNIDSKVSIGKGLNNGFFTFTSRTLTGVSSVGAVFIPFMFGLAVFDQDGDPNKEIALLDSDSSTLTIVQTSSGTVNQNTQVTSITLQQEAESIKSIKVDLDNLDDLVLLGIDFNILLSTNSFANKFIGPANSLIGMGLGDLNNDEIIDFAGKLIFLWGP